MAYKKGEETKLAILNGSKELFLKNGYKNTTFKQLGSHLGINPNLINYHYNNKIILAEKIVSDYYTAEDAAITQYYKDSFSPMLMYAIRNRLHYQIISDNQDIYEFYSEFVKEGLLYSSFSQLPYIDDMYNSFFKYYGVKKCYPSSFYLYMETGSEREIMYHFEPGMEKDETFISFVASVLPKFIGVPDDEIEGCLKKSKGLCKDIHFQNFKF